jgi:Asp-tRNA(Asn)/Glu-tRNA(Gln) amidotransferase C subunit
MLPTELNLDNNDCTTSQVSLTYITRYCRSFRRSVKKDSRHIKIGRIRRPNTPNKARSTMALYRTFLCSRNLTRSLPCSYPRAPVVVPPYFRRSESTQSPARKGIHPDELEQLLAEPTWSVESLLPPTTRAPDAPQITSRQLHHLLRLSALPPPETAEEEQKMLDNLAAQLHFVGKIQQVNTKGVEPLRAIRDETTAAEEEHTIGLEALQDALANEKVIGTHYRRIQRDTTPVDAKDAEDWDVLGSAERKAGKYFVVESERPHE